jgi:hypothetical protein
MTAVYAAPSPTGRKPGFLAWLARLPNKDFTLAGGRMARELRHWRLIEKLKVDEAGLLIAGVDPHALTSESKADIARGKTYEKAIKNASLSAFAYAFNFVMHPEQLKAATSSDIWEMSDEYDRFLPSLELRQDVAACIANPDKVALRVPEYIGFSETVCGRELRRWIEVNDIDSAYRFQDDQVIEISNSFDSMLEHDLGWSLDASSESKKLDIDSQVIVRETQHGGVWPWGDYETKLLVALADAAHQWWSTYDPPNTPAPTNEEVSDWLCAERKISRRLADAMATILRADGVPTGPRK